MSGFAHHLRVLLLVVDNQYGGFLSVRIGHKLRDNVNHEGTKTLRAAEAMEPPPLIDAGV